MVLRLTLKSRLLLGYLGVGALTATCTVGSNRAGQPAPALDSGAAGASAGAMNTSGDAWASVIGGAAAESQGAAAHVEVTVSDLVAHHASVESCDQCAATRAEACAPRFSACAADADCAAVLDCVYEPPGCSLDATGAQCVLQCMEQLCTSQAMAAVFLQAETCAYCGDDCAEACGGYCQALSQLGPSAEGCAGGAGGVDR